MSGNRHVGRVRWIARDVLVRDCGRIELAACEPDHAFNIPAVARLHHRPLPLADDSAIFTVTMRLSCADCFLASPTTRGRVCGSGLLRGGGLYDSRRGVSQFWIAGCGWRSRDSATPLRPEAARK